VVLSVCVPTSRRRHAFHELMYHNFKTQTYKYKELVVVDCSRDPAEPSEFLIQKMKEDPSVIYCHFPAEDAFEEKLYAQKRAQLLRAGANPQALPRSINYIAGRWPLGLKRNLCAHLASGALIAHFDDDDVYAPNYLEDMQSALLADIKKRKGLDKQQAIRYPAIATLSEWHMMDMDSLLFRYMDPKTEVMPQDWRQPMIDGYGFGYLFTRAAWEQVPFPDTEMCEDDIFMKGLRAMEKKGKAVVREVDLTGLGNSNRYGLVAHAFHCGCTSEGEWNGIKRFGRILSSIPQCFAASMPLVKEVQRRLPNKGAGGPPLAARLQPPPHQRPGYYGGKGKGWVGGKGKGKGKGGRR